MQRLFQPFTSDREVSKPVQRLRTKGEVGEAAILGKTTSDGFSRGMLGKSISCHRVQMHPSCGKACLRLCWAWECGCCVDSLPSWSGAILFSVMRNEDLNKRVLSRSHRKLGGTEQQRCNHVWIYAWRESLAVYSPAPWQSWLHVSLLSGGPSSFRQYWGLNPVPPTC